MRYLYIFAVFAVGCAKAAPANHPRTVEEMRNMLGLRSSDLVLRLSPETAATLQVYRHGYQQLALAKNIASICLSGLILHSLYDWELLMSEITTRGALRSGLIIGNIMLISKIENDMDKVMQYYQQVIREEILRQRVDGPT